MTMTGYQFYANALAIYLSNGQTLWIYLNRDSGKVFYRYKVGFPRSAKHTGIYVGTFANGTEYWIHNHINFGKAHLATGSSFRQGMQIYVHDEYCTNDWQTVIDKGLQHILKGERYMPYSFNCQVMTNDACHNVRKSADADRIVGGVLLGLAVVGLFAALAGSSSSSRS